MFGQGQFCKKSTEISEKFYYREDTLNSQMKLNFDLKSHHVRMDPLLLMSFYPRSRILNIIGI